MQPHPNVNGWQFWISEPADGEREEAQKTSPSTTLAGWFPFWHFVLVPHSREILRKRISWIVAQTMVRQLVSVVNTSI